MNIDKVKYPLRACVEIIWYCIMSNPVTENLKKSEIDDLISAIYGKEMTAEANKLIQGFYSDNAEASGRAAQGPFAEPDGCDLTPKKGD